MAEIKLHKFIKDFKCLSDKCPSTCCQVWQMKIDSKTKETYQNKAPELLESVDLASSTLKIDPITKFCVKLQKGKCGIHQDYGEEFLGDACYLYPRIIRKIDNNYLMTGALSCPETIRMVLFTKDPYIEVDGEITRTPSNMQDFDADYFTVKEFTDIFKTNLSGDEILAKIIIFAGSLNHLPKHHWLQASKALLTTIDARLYQTSNDKNNNYKLITAFITILKAAGLAFDPKYLNLLQAFETVFNIKINTPEQLVDICDARNINLQNSKLDHILKRYLEAQIHLNLYPFLGLGANPLEKIEIIAVKYALVKLFLQVEIYLNKNIVEENIINIILLISRLLDHLEDPKLSLLIYADFGWNNEKNLLGLVGGEQLVKQATEVVNYSLIY